MIWRFILSVQTAFMPVQVFESYVNDTTSKLSRKVEDLEDVRFVMSVLKEVDNLLPPLEDPLCQPIDLLL